jgi:hypothetical protein
LFSNGWNGYQYGATNTLNLNTTNSPRIGRVVMYLGYYKFSKQEQQQRLLAQQQQQQYKHRPGMVASTQPTAL